MPPTGDIQALMGPIAWLVLALTSFALAASLAEELRNILASMAALCFGLTDRIQRALTSAITWLRDWASAQVANEHGGQGGGPMYYIIGATISTMITVLLIAADLGVITLTVQALGFEETSIELPFDSTLVISISIICSAIFWCIVLFDVAGVTHLGPWGGLRGDSFFTSWIVWCAVAGLATALLIVTLMAGFRIEVMDQMAKLEASTPTHAMAGSSGREVSLAAGGVMLGGSESNLEPDPMATPFQTSGELKVCMMAISFLSLFTSAFSAVSLGLFLKFLAVVLVMAASLPMAALFLVVWVVNSIGNASFTVVSTLLELVIALGQRILIPIQPLLSWINRRSSDNSKDGPNNDSASTGTDSGSQHNSAPSQGSDSQNEYPDQETAQSGETPQDGSQAQKDPGFNPFGGGNK